jgi:hypothetical protein
MQDWTARSLRLFFVSTSRRELLLPTRVYYPAAGQAGQSKPKASACQVIAKHEPNHLRSQQIEEGKASSVVAVPKLRRSQSDERAQSIRGRRGEVDALLSARLVCRLTMVIMACSLMENLPGLMSKAKRPKPTRHLGSFSHARPIGKSKSCATT